MGANANTDVCVPIFGPSALAKLRTPILLDLWALPALLGSSSGYLNLSHDIVLDVISVSYSW